MSLIRRPLLSLCLATLVSAAVAAAWAQSPGPGLDERKKQTSSRNDRNDDDTLSDAVRRVERATQGEVLSAERVQFDGRDINRVKVVDDRGRVRIYVDDPTKRDADRPAKSGDGKPSPRTRGDDTDTPNL
ncbi:MAG: hypothetical protein M3R16_10870 [Pseudomonadota bacterium]|nr:hypothetical protein [Pseudomonadota bacterium]